MIGDWVDEMTVFISRNITTKEHREKSKYQLPWVMRRKDRKQPLMIVFIIYQSVLFCWSYKVSHWGIQSCPKKAKWLTHSSEKRFLLWSFFCVWQRQVRWITDEVGGYWKTYCWSCFWSHQVIELFSEWFLMRKIQL